MSSELLSQVDVLPTAVECPDDYELLAEALLETVKEQKELEGDKAVKQAKALVKQHGDKLKPWGKLEDTLRARLAAAKHEYEQAVQAAIEAGTEMPDELVDPQGISWRRYKKWKADASQLDDKYMTLAIDTKSIEAALESGIVPTGVELYDEWAPTVSLPK